jgi:hypothetical protein
MRRWAKGQTSGLKSPWVEKGNEQQQQEAKFCAQTGMYNFVTFEFTLKV